MRPAEITSDRDTGWVLCSGERTPASSAASRIKNTGAGAESTSWAASDSREPTDRGRLRASRNGAVSSLSLVSIRSTNDPTVLSSRSNLYSFPELVLSFCAHWEDRFKCTCLQERSAVPSSPRLQPRRVHYDTPTVTASDDKRCGIPKNMFAARSYIEGTRPSNYPTHSIGFCICDKDHKLSTLGQIEEVAYLKIEHFHRLLLICAVCSRYEIDQQGVNGELLGTMSCLGSRGSLSLAQFASDSGQKDIEIGRALGSSRGRDTEQY